ncbi:MAG: PAS domain S-box protein [Verrucomicrobia bacterium]|nr:PAS domain S-box protein [Verrucomicrobiota bacterium]
MSQQEPAHSPSGPGTPLRAKAEKQLARSKRPAPAETPQEVIHELQVHQIELEMQNEELKQAHNALEESRDKYFNLYDFSPIGYFTLTCDGLIAEANFTGAALLGLPRPQLPRHRFRQFIAPEDVERWDRTLLAAFEHEENQVCEATIRLKDGSEFQARLVCAQVAPATSRSMMMVRVAIGDISDRKRAEKAVRESEQQFRALFENMQDGASFCEMVFDAGGRPVDFVYLAVNDAFGRLTGLQDVVGKRVTEVLPGIREAHPELFDTFGRVAQTGKPERFEIEFKPLGILFTVSAYCPQPGHFAAIFDDITARKKAEEVLRHAKETLEVSVVQRTAELRKSRDLVEAGQQRFHQVLDMLPCYVVLLAPDYTVPFANKFFEGRFGKSEGRRCYEYLFNRTEPCENCETFKVLKTGQNHHWEWTGPDKRNYDIYDFPFKDVGGSPLIMEVGLDITEIKQAQAALKQSNETLEQRVAERTEQLESSQQRLMLAMRVAAIGVFEWDALNDVATWGNTRMAEILGQQPDDPTISRAQMVGEVVHPDDVLIFEKALAEARKPGQSYHATFRIRRRNDNALRWVEVMGRFAFAPDGTPVKLLAVMQDITERKEVENFLRAKNAELEHFNKIMIGRELRMIELKRQVNGLCAKLGQPPRYTNETADEQRP